MDHKLSIDILADIHLDPRPMRLAALKRALVNIKNTPGGCDLFISAGDTTDGGEKRQWFAFQELYEKIAPAKRTILALGNHDTWTSPYGAHRNDGEFDRALPLYTDCRRKVCGFRSDAAWYAETVNGVPFIMPGTSASDVGAQVDAEQVAWFREALREAAEYKTFIFVISHWALKNTHGLPYTFSRSHDANEYEGSLGDGGEEMLAEMKKYRNVVLISGHSHMGWTPPERLHDKGWSSVEGHDGVLCVNLPCFMFPNHDGDLNMRGLGMRIEMEGRRAELMLKNYLAPVPLGRYAFTAYTD